MWPHTGAGTLPPGPYQTTPRSLLLLPLVRDCQARDSCVGGPVSSFEPVQVGISGPFDG